MKKIVKKMLPFALCLVFVFSAACSGKKQPAGESKYELWGAHSLVKVQRDLAAQQYAAEKRDAELVYEMAKNEYENAQIILTAETDIRSFTATVSDLAGPGGARIPSTDITVYKQRYTHVKVNMTDARPFKPGWYPDALVPMDAAYEKGENTVSAGENQGIWVTVKTTKDTAPGTYTGALTVTVDGKANSVPVTAEVWDFTVPDEVHTQTCFHYFSDFTVAGELDNSEEMWAKYVNAMAEYRVSISDVPYYDFYDVEGWAQVAKEYAAKPGYAGFKLPYRPIVRTVELIDPINPALPTRLVPDVDYDLLERQLLELAEVSTPENPVLKKAFMYFSYSLDEAWMTGGEENVRYINTMVHRKLIEVADKIEAEHGTGYWAEHGIERDDIVKMQNLNTDPYLDSIAGFVPTYVPTVDNFNTADQREKYKREEEGEISSGTTWWYHCVDPKAPYPTYHTDDYLASARTISWMQYEYGIDGMLYWGTQSYPNATTSYPVPMDIWDDATKLTLRAADNGDGYLFYPGLEYGVDGPLPSIRLQAIRDGLEDYEYLWLFERELEEANETYGTDYTADEVLEKIFRTVYTGVISVTDADVIQSARRSIAEMLQLISSDAQAFVRVAEIDADTETATVEVLYNGDYTLTAGGEEQQKITQKDGVKSVVTVDLTGSRNYFEGVLSKGSESIELSAFVATKVMSVNRFETDADIQKVTVSKGNKAEAFDHIAVERADFDGRSAAKVTVAPSDMGSESLNVRYRPGIYFDKETHFADTKMSEIDVISLDVYNAGAEAVTVTLKLYAGSAFDQTIATLTLQPGEWATLRGEQVYNLSWSRLDSVTRIAVEMTNDLTNTRTMYMDGLYFTEKA